MKKRPTLHICSLCAFFFNLLVRRWETVSCCMYCKFFQGRCCCLCWSYPKYKNHLCKVVLVTLIKQVPLKLFQYFAGPTESVGSHSTDGTVPAPSCTSLYARACRSLPPGVTRVLLLTSCASNMLAPVGLLPNIIPAAHMLQSQQHVFVVRYATCMHSMFRIRASLTSAPA